MALEFPLGVDDFFADLRISAFRLTLREFILTSGTAENLLTAELHGPLWAAEITTPRMSTADAIRIAAKMRRVGAHGRFMIFDKAHPYPTHDPDGSKIAGFTPSILGKGSDNRSISLTGMPNNFRLYWGDKIQVTYGSGPLRRQLLEVNDDVIAGSAGNIPLFEVTPPLRAGITPGDPVYIRRPSCQMQFTDYDTGVNSLMISGGMTFNAIEVIV